MKGKLNNERSALHREDGVNCARPILNETDKERVRASGEDRYARVRGGRGSSRLEDGPLCAACRVASRAPARPGQRSAMGHHLARATRFKRWPRARMNLARSFFGELSRVWPGRASHF